MKTIFDLVSVALFAGLAILYLQRSAAEEPDKIPLWRYAAAAVGCAAADYLGNNGFAVASGVIFVIVIGFSIIMLKPFETHPSP